MPGIDEQQLWDDYERLKKGPNGSYYQTLSPRVAIETAQHDASVPEAEKAAMRDRHQEYWFQSAAKGFGRGLGVDTIAELADYTNPARAANYVMGKPEPPKIGGYIADLLERSPIQSTANNLAGMGGTIAGYVIPYSKAAKVAEGVGLGVKGLAALRAALTGAQSASYNYQDQDDAIQYGEQHDINPTAVAVSGLTSAAGSAANSALGPMVNRRWIDPASKLVDAARTTATTPTEGVKMLGRAALQGGKGIALNAAVNGTEEAVQSVGERWNARHHQTREGAAAAENAPSPAERFILGSIFGIGGELLDPLSKMVRGLPVAHPPTTIGNVLDDVPLNTNPAAGPINPQQAAALNNPRALTATPAPVSQKAAPGPNAVAPLTTQTFAGRNSPQKVQSVQHILAHQTAEDIRRTTAVAKQWLARKPDPHSYWRDLETGQEIPVWRLNKRWFGEFPNGEIADVTDVDTNSFEAMRFRRPDKTLPAGSQGPAILHDSTHRWLPEQAQVTVNIEGQPHLVVARGKRDFSTKDVPYGMIPLDPTKGLGGLHPTDPNRAVRKFLPADAKAERAKIKAALLQARQAMSTKKPKKVTSLLQAPRVPSMADLGTDFSGTLSPELVALLKNLGMP